MKKIAISLPEPVLKTVDRLAARRGESRSRTIATILSRVARAKRDRDLTAQIDALFADETIIPEQKRTADEFLRMTSWPKVENAFVLLERKCLSQILSATLSRRPQHLGCDNIRALTLRPDVAECTRPMPIIIGEDEIVETTLEGRAVDVLTHKDRNIVVFILVLKIQRDHLCVRRHNCCDLYQ